VRFEDYTPARKFDVVLMSESAQYIKMRFLYDKVKAALAPGGTWLVCDYFRKTNQRTFYKSCRWLDEFMGNATAAGFEHELLDDFTERAAGTLVFGGEMNTRYINPLVNIARDWFQIRMPKITAFFKAVFRKSTKRMKDYVEEIGPAQLDPERFKAEMAYRIYAMRLRA
jgi:hypothetical protein